jgi:hypothetical protein
MSTIFIVVIRLGGSAAAWVDRVLAAAAGESTERYAIGRLGGDSQRKARHRAGLFAAARSF